VTEKIYYKDPLQLEFDARVVESSVRNGRCEVILDGTCFYPGGGGQPCDQGTLGGARVVEVGYGGAKGAEEEEESTNDGQIVHVVEPALAAEPAAVLHGVVDGRRRRDFMAQHTGQHIFSQALMQAGKLETVSVHFGDDDTTIEVKADTVSEKTLAAAEEIANTVIRENRKIILHEVDRSEAGRFPLRRTPPNAARLRIVEVEGFEWAACGGVHVRSTGEIVMARAVATERIRGRVRIHVMMGQRALEDYGRKISLVQGLGRELTCGEADILARVRELLNDARESARELKKLQATRAAADADAALAAGRRIGTALCVRGLFEAAGPEYLKAFAERVLAAAGRVVMIADRNGGSFQWIVAHSLGETPDLSRIIPGLLSIAAAKGGGRGARMQGIGGNPGAAEAFLDAVEKQVALALGQGGNA
jgi:alanyl-tRNA synthetase